MAVGYASFESSLTIKGSSKITSNWDVEIINISEPDINGSAEEVEKSIGEDKLSANIEANLYEKDDYIEYIVTIKNKGTISAKLGEIVKGTETNTDAVSISFYCYDVNWYECESNMKNMTIDANEELKVKVKIAYNPSYEGGEISGTSSIRFNFVQEDYEKKDEEFVPVNNYKLTYDCNGGKEEKVEYLYENSLADLTKTCTKDGYIFKGWNVSSSSIEPLDTYMMPAEDKILYALYDIDNVSITNISVTKTTNSITVVPSATADSGIAKYEYKLDDGDWIEDKNMHIFTNLTHNTNYKIMVRVTSNTNKKVSQEKIDSSCSVTEGTTYNFSYTGSEQTFTPSCRGTYTLEAWGAQGGGTSTRPGGKGAYTKGELLLNTGDSIYVYVGGEGAHIEQITNIGGYNGGGYSGNNAGSNSYGGGGATDFRLVNGNWNLIQGLKSRIMVASAGGGNVANTSYSTVPGVGGTLIGQSASGTYSAAVPTGGTQTGPGESFEGTRSGYFGYSQQTNTSGWGGGGGSGYYGGSNGHGYAGAGGSSFISGHSGCDAIKNTSNDTIVHSNQSIHYSGYKFTNTVMKAGNEIMPSVSGSTETGHSGNGYAKVTFGSKLATPYTSKLDAPTYIENTPGEVTITYPLGCTDYICSYKINNGEEVTVNTNTTISFKEDGIVTAYVKDKNGSEIVNTVSSSYTLVKNKLYVKSDGNDTSGYGTINSPYLTLTKAYEKATILDDSTIYVMDNITQTDTTTMDNNKDITITSCTKTGTNCNYSSNNSIKKGQVLSNNLIKLSSGNLTTNNITFNGNNLEDSEAGFYAALNTVININSGTTITSFKSTSSLGGAISSDGKVIMTGGTITGNTGQRGGGIKATTLHMSGGTISNNTASAYGGGIRLDKIGTMTGGTISGNTASSGGGGINVNGASAQFTFSGGTFSNNSSSVGGGLESSGTLNISGGTISDNKANTNGGGIASSGTLTINNANAKIQNNTAVNMGGGIYTSGSGTLTMSNGTISGNKATTSNGYGGGIQADGTGATNISGGSITSNTARTYGGGLFVGGSNTTTITAGTISSNKATSNEGGGIRVNGTLNFKGGTISSNTAGTNGGGISNPGTSTLSGGTISSNKAVRGGGIYNTGTGTLSGATITGNSSTNGGGAWSNKTFNVNSGTISNNTASSYGGAINYTGTVKIAGGNLTGNKAANGGALFGTGSPTTTISGGNIKSNTATSVGGGIGFDSGTVTISGGTIIDNTSSVPRNNNIYFISTNFVDSKAGITLTEATYKIVSAGNNNMSLDVSGGAVGNGTNVQIWSYGSVNQQWRFKPSIVTNGTVYYHIESQIRQTQYLDNSANSSTSGNNVQTYEWGTGNGEKWYLTNAGSGYWYFKTYTNLCLDISGGNMANGTNVQAYSCNSSNAQKWKPVRV